MDLRVALGDRSLFPTLAARSYLNHAAISPLSSVAVERAHAVLSDYASLGLDAFVARLPERDRLKTTLGNLLGADADELGFTQNTTAGVTAIAQMIPWKPGDRVILFEGEFPANVTPWQCAARTWELELVWIPIEPFARDHQEGLELLRHELERGARIVAVSAVQFQTGLRMPVDAIGSVCHSHGAELFVDAIQGLGAVPLSIERVDYLSCGGHKWLMGPEGTGFVYIDRRRAGALEPRLGGWLGHEDALDFLFLGPGHLRYDRPLRREANVVEQGAQSSVGLAALEGAVDLISQLGVPAIYAHVQSFHDQLEPELQARGFRSIRTTFDSGRSATLSVLPSVGTVAEWASHFGEHGIAVTTPDGHLRFAPHWPNSLDEVQSITRAIDAR